MHRSIITRPPAVSQAMIDSAYAACRRVARRTARNFYYSFLLLPPAQRRAMCALYTFMRLTDDLADSSGPAQEAKIALSAWRDRLDNALDGHPDRDLWWLALADTMERYEIRPEYLHAVIDGVESDLQTSGYATFSELYRYCFRVASAVGLACLRIWGVRDPDADLPAEWCGIAFQLTNILRDIHEDFERGRIYIPQEDLERFGVAEDELGCYFATSHFEQLMHFQIARANDYYERSTALKPYLPPSGRAMFWVMTGLYRGLLKKIEQDPTRVLRERVSLKPIHKFRLVLQAWPMRFLPPRLAASFEA